MACGGVVGLVVENTVGQASYRTRTWLPGATRSTPDLTVQWSQHATCLCSRCHAYAWALGAFLLWVAASGTHLALPVPQERGQTAVP